MASHAQAASTRARPEQGHEGQDSAQTPVFDPSTLGGQGLSPEDALNMARSHGNEALQAMMGGEGGGDDGAVDLGGLARLDPGVAIEAALAGSEGKSLPADLARTAQQGLGESMQGVTLHASPQIQEILDSLGVLALAWGDAILEGLGGQSEGVRLHELAHVAQSGGRTPAPGQPLSTGSGAAEDDAHAASDALMAGESYQVSSQAPMARGFGATAGKDENGNRRRDTVCHENQTVDSATSAGFTEDEANMIYSGNWQRDMNQMILPLFGQGGNAAIYDILDLAHQVHFGFGLPSVEEFGSYDPVEHIDNPGGLVGSGVFNQFTEGPGQLDHEPALGGGDSAHSTETMGGENDPLASLDPRYIHEAAEAQNESIPLVDGVRGDGSEEGEATEAAAFQVDAAGIPVYMRASRSQLIASLANAVGLAGQDRPRALRMVGEGMHVMQDYYAHSNFVEIAMNVLLRERDDVRYDEEGNRTEDGSGRTVSEIFQDAGHDLGEFNLDTYVHEISTDEEGNRLVMDDENLQHNGREVMATGTFMLSDTLHSLKEKLNGAITALNPFAKGKEGPSETVIRVLDWMQQDHQFAPTVNFGPVAEKIRGIKTTIDPIFGRVASGAEGASGLAADGMRTAGDVAGTIYEYSPTGIAERLITGENAVSDAARDATDSAADGVEGAGRASAEQLRGLTTGIETAAQSVETAKLSDMYVWINENVSPLLSLKNAARNIPVIGDDLVDAIETAEDEIREQVRKLLDDAWQAAKRQVIAELDSLISEAIGSTEVTEDNGAQTMTQPTHTDIAKDFDEDDHGTHDTYSIIEEAAEWVRDVSNDADSTLEEWADGARDIPTVGPGVADTLDEVAEHVSDDHLDRADDDDHQHQHRHGGAWLAGLANMMAHASSRAILTEVNGLMDGPVAEDQSARDVEAPIARAVNEWFAHPEDCRGKWEGPFAAALQGNVSGIEDVNALLEDISHRTHSAPSAQAPNVHQSAEGAGSGDHAGHDHDHRHDHHEAEGHAEEGH
ncbi:MAG: DUF4157 domain-containing protein [Alphaproteobacteria bacterium]|nr:DUF4157 domain-containing protein [Alphaproteobacteria bacterium]MCB9794773.1 DUF4157 domain-containing protein [Alphaproteobacteria bacterium]